VVKQKRGPLSVGDKIVREEGRERDTLSSQSIINASSKCDWPYTRLAWDP
jgi:hypothetical protein